MANSERGPVVNGALFVVEKSTYATVPLTLLAIVSGGVAPAVGILALGIDVGGSVVARRMRNSSE